MSLVCAVGCSSDDEDHGVTPGRGLATPTTAAPVERDPRTARRLRAQDPQSRPDHRVIATPLPSEPIHIVERAEGTEQGPQPERRDPAAELRAMVGDPASCLTDADRQLQRDIAFDVTVSALATGTPASAVVSSAGVSDEARACVRRRVLGSHFAPFDALTTVRASVVLRRAPPPEAPPAAPAHQTPNAG